MQKTVQENSLNDLKIVLNKVCQLTNFSYGEIWLPNEESDFLEISPNYYVVADRHQLDFQLFHECSQGFIMSKGEGLPGRVFKSEKPEWMLDVSVESENSFLRNKIAGICGVKTGFSIPIIRKKKVLAVLAFFSRDIRSISSKHLALAADLATKSLTSSSDFNKN